MSEVKTADLSSLRIKRDEQPQVKQPRRWGGYIITLVVLLALVVGWYYFKSSLMSAPEIEIASASMVSPSQGNSVLAASGYVVAQRKAAVSSKISGRLVELKVIEGDVVHQNQVIGRIESADVEANLSQLKAALDLAKADFDNAQAELDDASKDYARKKSLHDANAVTTSDFDIATARKRRAEASLAARQANIKMAEANIRNAEVQIENTVLRAPFDGTVLSKNANVGEVITVLGSAAGSRGAVVTIADMNSLEVEADVSESNIERVASDQPCEVTLDAYPEKRYPAFVSKIIPTADRAKATVQVKIRFQQRDARVLPEMSAKVLFLKQSAQATDEHAQSKLMIPTTALHTKDGKTTVFVFDAEHVRETSVQVGQQSNGLVEVTSGLRAGDKVVVSSTESLKDGIKAQLKK